jgi:acetyl-CoA carboxylase carboxyltransferase component
VVAQRQQVVLVGAGDGMVDQPRRLGGTIDCEAAQKAARFAEPELPEFPSSC